MIRATVTFTAPLADPPIGPPPGGNRLPLARDLLGLIQLGIRLEQFDVLRIVATIDADNVWRCQFANVERLLNEFFGPEYDPVPAYWPGARAVAIAHDVAFGLAGEVTSEATDDDEPETDDGLPPIY